MIWRVCAEANLTPLIPNRWFAFMEFVIMNDPVQLILVFDFLKIFILKILTVENRSFLEHWLIFQGND